MQKEILQGFERDMEQLASLQLHAGARTERHSRLIHLIPEQKMRDWAARCKHDHDHFAKKVGPSRPYHVSLNAYAVYSSACS